MLIFLLSTNCHVNTGRADTASCLFCCVKLFLLHLPEAESLFREKCGYQVLLKAVVSVYASNWRLGDSCPESNCRECAHMRSGALQEGKAKRAMETQDSRDGLPWSLNMKYCTLFLSIILDCDITLEVINGCLDHVSSRPVLPSVRVNNMIMLATTVQLLDNGHAGVRLLGIQVVDILLRIHPPAVCALSAVGGKSMLRNLVVDISLGRNIESVCDDMKSVAGSSPLSSSPLLSSTPSQSYVARTADSPGELLLSKHTENAKGSSPPSAPPSAAASISGASVSVEDIGICDTGRMSQDDALLALVPATRVLARVAVIMSQTSTEELSLLLMLALRLGQNLYSMCRLSTLWLNGRLAQSHSYGPDDPIPLSLRTMNMCSNCEVEAALYECSHQR